MRHTEPELFVDSDNALGSPSGDVDDAFALAALILGGAKISAIAGIFGNTTSLRARRNHRALADVLGWPGAILAGAAGKGDQPTEASRYLANTASRLRVLGLGPLTNVAAALAADSRLAPRIDELIFVGTNLSSHGRWPPYYPFDFNLTADRAASVRVLRSEIPLTLVPLDVARNLRVSWREVAALEGDMGRLAKAGAHRWWIRGLLFYGARTLPVWDLVAAMYALQPGLFRVEEKAITVHDNAWVEFNRGDKRARVLTAFDRDEVWRAFEALCAT